MSDPSTFRAPQASMVPYGCHREVVYRHLISRAKSTSEFLESVGQTGERPDSATGRHACKSVLRFISDTEYFYPGRSVLSQLATQVQGSEISPTVATANKMWKEISQNTDLDESLKACIQTPDQSTDMPGLDVISGADEYNSDDIHVGRSEPPPTITVSSATITDGHREAIPDDTLASQGQSDDVEARGAVLGHRGKGSHRLSVGSASGSPRLGALSDLPVRRRRKSSGGGSTRAETSGVRKIGHRRSGSRTSVSLTSPGGNQNTSTVRPSEDEPSQLDELAPPTPRKTSPLDELEELEDTPSSRLPRYEADRPRLRSQQLRKKRAAGEGP